MRDEKASRPLDTEGACTAASCCCALCTVWPLPRNRDRISALFLRALALFAAEVAALVAEGEKSRSKREFPLGDDEAALAAGTVPEGAAVRADGGLGYDKEGADFAGTEELEEEENDPPPKRSIAVGCCRRLTGAAWTGAD